MLENDCVIFKALIVYIIYLLFFKSLIELTNLEDCFAFSAGKNPLSFILRLSALVLQINRRKGIQILFNVSILIFMFMEVFIEKK